MRQLIDWQREVTDPTEFVEGLKLDVFQDQVFVFTPKGEVKDLPRGATPLDFAYRIHTDVGHRTIGAKVNNRLVPLDYRLRNGDIVEIVTTKAAHGPTRDWLNIVRTSHAREKIRAWFKRQQRDENITQGKELLDRELRRLAHETLAGIDCAKLTEIAAQYQLQRARRLLRRHRLRRDLLGSGRQQARDPRRRRDQLPEEAPPAAPSTTGVKVKGVGDLLVRFAKCCSPIPGDDITGYVTRGKGVTVHRASCPSVLSERDIERLIDVEWELAGQQTYPITVRITALDRPGLLNEVTNVVAEYKVNIVAASVATHADGTATITATFKVTSLQQLAKVLTKIERLRDVTSVTREAQLTDEGRSGRGRRRHRPGRHPDLRDHRHQRRSRIEVTTARGVVEVSEVTRSGTPVRTGRFMHSRLVALVEHPAHEGPPRGRSRSRPAGAWAARASERRAAGPIDSEPMAKKIAAPRGTRDLLPRDARLGSRRGRRARSVAAIRIRAHRDPAFERVELFARGLGESSDAVEKEMFRVAGARGSDEERAEWALRPEPTAGIVRAFIEHGMHVRPGPLRLDLIGPMFRYDRPQAGRFRQFSQWDVEVIGDPGPAVDAELDRARHRFYAEVGLTDVVAHVNSIGDATCRPGYRQALVDYFSAHRRPADRGLTTPPRGQPAARARRQGPGGRPGRWRAEDTDHLCDECRAHFRACSTCSMRWASATSSTIGWCAASTTTRAPRSSSSSPGARGSSRRRRRWSLRRPGRAARRTPTPGIGFGIGLDRTVLALEEQGVRLPRALPSSRCSAPATTTRTGCGSPASSAPPA